MGMMAKSVGVAGLVGALAGCAAPEDPFAIRELPKGAQIDVRSLLAANRGKLACIDYEAATNSCASLVSAKLQGNTLRAREAGAAVLPDGSTQRIEVRSRSRVSTGESCAGSKDFTVVGSDPFAVLVQDATRALVDDFGGSVCGAYFEGNGVDYVIRSTGANGQPFPPGDSTFRFVDGGVAIRAQ